MEERGWQAAAIENREARDQGPGGRDGQQR